MLTKYLDANGNEVPLSTLERGALIGDMSVDEYASLAGFTIKEDKPGKTNDSAEGIALAESEIMTTDGDSSSVDTSSEQFENDNYITAEDLALSEEQVSKMLNKKLAGLGLYVTQTTGKKGYIDAISIKRRGGEQEKNGGPISTFLINPVQDIIKGFEWNGSMSPAELEARAKEINAEINRLKNDNYLTEAQERSGDKYSEYKIATTPAVLSSKEAIKLYEEDRDNKFNKIKRFRDDKGFDVSFENKDFESEKEEAQYNQYLEGLYIDPPTEEEIEVWQEKRNDGYASKESIRFTNDLDDKTRLDLEAIAINEQAIIKSKVDNLSKTLKAQEQAFDASLKAFKENPTENNRLVALTDFENIQGTIAAGQELAIDEEGLPLAIKDFGANYSRFQQLTSNVKGLGADINYAAAQFAGIMGYPDKYVQNALNIATTIKEEQSEFQRSLGVDEIKSVDDAGMWLASSTTSLLPSLGMSFTGPLALPLFFMSGVGSTGVDIAIKERDAAQRMVQNNKILSENPELGELERMAIENQMANDSKILNIPEWRKITAQVWNGLAEIAFEKTGTLFLIKNLKEGAKLLKPETVKKAFGKLGADVGKAIPIEGGSEWATNSFQNFADIYILDEDKNFFEALGDEKLFEGGLETLAQGSLMGGGMAVGGNLNSIKEATVSEMATKAQNNRIKEIIAKLESLTGIDDLKNAGTGVALPSNQSEEINKLVAELTQEADDIKNNILARIGYDLSIENLKTVGDLNRKMRKVNSDFRRLMENGDLGAAQLQAIEKEYRGKFDALAEEREGILTNDNLSKETIKETSGTKVNFDSQVGYGLYAQRLLNESVIGVAKEWNNVTGSRRNNLFNEAKAELENENPNSKITSSEIQNKARNNFYDSRYSEKIEQGKKNVEAYVKASGLNVEITEFDGPNAAADFELKLIELGYSASEAAAGRVKAESGQTEGVNVPGENKNNADNILIYKPNAVKNKRIGVYAHELLHSIAKQQSNSKDVDAAGEKLLSYLEKSQPDLYAKVKFRVDESYTITNADGSVTKKEDYFEEVMNAMSDVLADGQTVDNNFLLQAKLFVNSFFPNKFEIKSDEAIYQFIRGFNKKSHFGGKGTMQNFSNSIADDDKNKEGKVEIVKTAKQNLKELAKNPKTKFSLSNPNEFKSSNKADLFTVTVNAFNEATELYGLDIKLNEDGTPAFTKAEWDSIDDNTKLGLGFMIGETWKPYVSYLMGSRRDVPGFDEYANQIIDKTATGVEKGDDGIPFLIKTYNPEAGAKLSTHIFGQVSRRLQGVINKQDGFGEITVDAVSDKPGAKELVQEESTAVVEETPKYRNLLRRRIVSRGTMNNIKSKIKPIIRVLKTRMDVSVSKNVTTKPWVNELRLQLGKQIDIDLKQEMGGVKDGQLRRFLLKNKTAILENMTTTYLAGAMPFAVQKSVAGVYTSNWKGEKIDRETTETGKAGRTSGNELVRRLPKASSRISDAEFLSAIVGPGGNPIRGRKESLAKAIAEELSLDIISEELQNPDSDIAQAFAQNQEMLGVAITENTANEAKRDFERGSIKFSERSEAIAYERGIKLTAIDDIYAIKAKNNPNGELTEDQEDEKRIEKAEVMSLVIDKILVKDGFPPMPNPRTKQGREDMKEYIKDILIPNLPREALFGPRFGSSFTASSGLLGMSYKDPIWIQYVKDIKKIGREAVEGKDFAPSLSPANGVVINFKTIPFKKFAKGGATSIKNNIAGIKQANKQNMAQYRALLTMLYKIAKDKKNRKLGPGIVAAYLHTSSNHSTHIHRLAAAFVGYSEDFKYGKGKGVLEHTMTSSEALTYVINIMLESKDAATFEKMIDTLMAQYTVIALSKESDNLLIGWLKNNMPEGWDINTGLWVARYQAGGIDLNKIKMFNGKTLQQLMESANGKAFIKALNNKNTQEQLVEITNNPKQYAKNVKTAYKESATSSRNKVVEISTDLNKSINDMIERDSGVSSTQEFSEVQAKLRGKKIGKYKFFSPFADDFRGLTSYTFAGKGKQGEADQKFFEDNLIKPYQRGINAINVAKQTVKKDFAKIVKIFKFEAKQMKENLPGSDFTYDQALRVYLWTRQGMEVPGMSKDDTIFLNQAIKNNPKLIEFANAILLASKQGEWMAPTDHWLTETVLSDLNNMSERVGRATYLAEFIEASEVIFSPENLNKIQAVYGKNHADAIKDSLYAMRTGTNRPEGTNATVNRWNNWLNQSTGAIMFFNRRSAVLQLLSTANFINWSDNNPLKAAMAFANQKQFWTDFAMIFNSAKLKERRSGLKNDVNASELSNAVKGSTNKAAAALNYLLTIGFKPTQIADSFAIASGGATFYRNRVKTYLKQGMSQKEAEALAFEEFSSTADEAQQSSDPMLVSSQQRSILGRIILAFQNTPMQYTRLMKKAGQDLINRRGDPKTNISKIIYYGAIQNLIFASLQSALFAFIPGFDDNEDEDPEKRQKKLEGKEIRIVNSMIDSLLKGSGLTGAVIATIKNTAMEYKKQKDLGFLGNQAYTIIQALSISPPLSSKVRKIYSATTADQYNKDAMTRGASVMADGRLNLSPYYSIFGNLVSATLNVPLDRIVDEVTSIVEATDARNTGWQRLALALGWKTWDVNAKNEEHDLLKIEGTKERKIQRKVDAAVKKVQEQKRIDNLTPAERKAEIEASIAKKEEALLIRIEAQPRIEKAVTEELNK